MNKYTSYRVDVRSPGAGMTSTQVFSAVLRRYSDFLWLYDRLQEERPGAIVPPIPEKQPVGRFSPAFVEARRRELERFIRRVAIHPELQDSACLDTFLRADDVTLQAAKNSKTNVVLQQSIMMPHMSAPPQMMMTTPPKKEGFKRWFAETKTSMTGDLVRSPDDELFEEIQRYVHGLDTQMKNVATQATGLVRKGKEMANGLFEFGLAFNLLGQSEADALGDALCKLGETADRLSVLSAEHADQESMHFEDPLVDMIKMIHSAKLALHKRHEKRLTYSTCLQEVESKHSQLAKLRAQFGMEAKAYAMEMSLKRGQDAAEVAREDFAGVSQRVLREVDRFKRETTEDMRRTVLEYIQLQVEYNKKMEEIWANLIPQLERVQLDSNANVIGGDAQAAASGSTQYQPAPPVRPPEPQIHSEPVITPNPQQAMQAHNGFYGQQQQGMSHDPGMFVQYRQDGM
jgi:sorting nexin-1/2